MRSKWRILVNMYLHELLQMCYNWFSAAHALQTSRKAREEAWRQEFTGRKGELHDLFDSIDVDGGGYIEYEEVHACMRMHSSRTQHVHARLAQAASDPPAQAILPSKILS